MAFPDFIVGGAQKSGTTSLFYILKQHPQILLPSEEETRFFDTDENFNKGEAYYNDLYASEGDAGSFLKGDFTANYLFFEFVPKRIAETLGDQVKLIFILRNPVDRAYSQYMMNIRNNIEDLDFQNALKEEGRRLESASIRTRIRYSYTSRGLYAKQLKRYFSYFPAQNIKVILFEEFYGQNKEEEVKNIQQFLNVDVVELDTDIQKFKSGVTRFPILAPLLSANNKKLAAIRNNLPLPSFVRKMLWKALFKDPGKLTPAQKEHIFYQYFQNDAEELANLLGKDVISCWGYSKEYS